MPSSKIQVASLSTLRVSKHMIPAHDRLPNSSILHKPLLIYHAAFLGAGDDDDEHTHSVSTAAAAVEAHLRFVGVVVPHWRYSMYPTTHFHSTTHEVLCVTSGRARLCFGGEANPARVEATVQAGDVMVLPAGVAHRLLEDLSGGRGRRGFEMVGSYPKGFDWDMCYGKAEEQEKVKSIGKLEWFQKDPIFGEHGPVLDV